MMANRSVACRCTRVSTEGLDRRCTASARRLFLASGSVRVSRTYQHIGGKVSELQRSCVQPESCREDHGKRGKVRTGV